MRVPVAGGPPVVLDTHTLEFPLARTWGILDDVAGFNDDGTVERHGRVPRALGRTAAAEALSPKEPCMSLSLSLNVDLDLGLGLGSKGAQRMFALRLGVLGPTDLSVVSFKGRERLSEPFRYDVVFATSAPETVVMSSLAHPASLALAVPGGTSAGPGARRVDPDPRSRRAGSSSSPYPRGDDRRRYRVGIVPRLWLLKHRRRSRVFQDKTVVQIARRLLDRAGAHREFRVDYDDHAPIRSATSRTRPTTRSSSASSRPRASGTASSTRAARSTPCCPASAERSRGSARWRVGSPR